MSDGFWCFIYQRTLHVAHGDSLTHPLRGTTYGIGRDDIVLFSADSSAAKGNEKSYLVKPFLAKVWLGNQGIVTLMMSAQQCGNRVYLFFHYLFWDAGVEDE
jgi:hypothetical protein